MRTLLIRWIQTLALALLLTGCSVMTGANLPGSDLTPTTVASPATAAAPTAEASPTSVALPTASPSPADVSPTPVPSPTALPPKSALSPTANPAAQASPVADQTAKAIQAVVERANQEQQDAFTKHDPTVMRDTATADYYKELVQINTDMASGGVATIKLVKIEWGPVKLANQSTDHAVAEVTTFETWRTTYADGSTDQSRDQNDYTLVQEQGVWKIQADDHPAGDPNSGSAHPATPPNGSPTPGSPTPVAPPTAPKVGVGQDISHNWSGYAATDGKFTSVSGTWIVPEPQAGGSYGTGATWVGIGGVTSHDLVQAGTEEMTNGSGASHYEAWIETLPRPSQPVPFTVNPGDSVTVSLSQQGSNGWLIKFQNNTTGQSYEKSLQYKSSLSSAEWVEEAPSARRGVLPLDNFGTVQFSAGSATKDGKSVSIAKSGAQPVKMADAAGQIIATPSDLSTDGQGFTVRRTGADATSAAPLRPVGQ